MNNLREIKEKRERDFFTVINGLSGLQNKKKIFFQISDTKLSGYTLVIKVNKNPINPSLILNKI